MNWEVNQAFVGNGAEILSGWGGVAENGYFSELWSGKSGVCDYKFLGVVRCSIWKELTLSCINLKAGIGDMIAFCKDSWATELPLRSLLQGVYRLCEKEWA